MWIAETIAAAFSMYSVIPVPDISWNERNIRYILCAFPLIGAVIGLCWQVWIFLCSILTFPAILRGAGLCLIPVVITGGIHLDGYADVSDALASHAPPEKKREILHDPHCGAFAIIRLCVYFTGYFSLCVSLMPEKSAVLSMEVGFILSRSLSALALTMIPLSAGSRLARTFAAGANRSVRAFLTAELAAACFGMCVFGGWNGVFMILSALAVFGRCVRTARREFDGISGDLAGWVLQKTEFWMLAALVLAQYMEIII